MKIVFMGTPDFAAGALKSLIEAGHEITAVVTQPDKAKGRSQKLLPPPVEEVEKLKQYPADIYVVAAFGQILSQEILDIPEFGCLNIHASLLPKYRGASPIQHVIIDGEEKTGITIMQMDAGLETGDMLYQKEIVISPKDTYASLHDKLMVLGGEAIVEALPLLEQGKLVPRKQEDALSCYAHLIDKTMGELDFTKSAEILDRLIRGLNPWPSAYTTYHGKQLKVWEAEPVKSPKAGKPGEILAVEKDAVLVAAGSGALRITSLQLSGKKRMSAHDFLLGVRMTPGEILGCEE